MSASTPATDQVHRPCGHCGELLPLAHFDFRRRDTGQRMTVCKSCRSVAGQAKRNSRQANRFARMSREILAARSAHRVTAVVDRMVACFGVDGLVARWAAAIERGGRNARCTRQVLLSFRALARLIEHCHPLAKIDQQPAADETDPRYDPALYC